MPPSIRPEPMILDALLSSCTANGLVTDTAPISVVRQLTGGVSITVAELYYSLWTLYQSFFLSLATATDLDTRGRDMGLSRDTGSPASGTVLYSRAVNYLEDIPLPVPQHLAPIVALGIQAMTYSTLAEGLLEPCGRSISGLAPVLTTTSSVDDVLALSIDNDGVRVVSLGTQLDGVSIAAAIETAVRALLANAPTLQPAYDRFRADWNVTTPNAFTLRSGNPGPTSSVVVSAALGADASAGLKLGLTAGGTERIGMDSLAVPVQADVIGLASNLGAEQLTEQRAPVPGIAMVSNPLPFVDGREVASDDAYRQAVQAHLLALGRGTTDNVLYTAQYSVRLANGERPVQSAQVVPGGDGNITVFVSDGRSLTVGAQPEVVAAVQATLDGRGSIPGGVIPSGMTALVRPSTIRVIDVTMHMLLSPSTDAVVAQRQAITTVTHTLNRAPVGTAVRYIDMLRALDAVIEGVLRIDFTLPIAWTLSPQADLGAIVGTQLMAGTIQVTVVFG